MNGEEIEGIGQISGKIEIDIKIDQHEGLHE
jgi:hypothetical protein